MTVKQISVFLENKPGQLVELTDILSAHQIDMRALSIADTKDFGILRLIVDDPDKTAEVLKAAECVFSVAPVLAVEIADEPGSLSKILHILSDHGVNLEYTYAFITRRAQSAYMILRVEDNETTAAILAGRGVKLATQDELYRL